MHSIKYIAHQTGLSQHTIRAWERRYGALTPDRTPTNRRLYSESDLKKLSLLHRAVQAGHSIGQIAHLSLSELQNLVNAAETSSARDAEKMAASEEMMPSVPDLEACLRAVDQLDAEALKYNLTRAAGILGAITMIERVVMPLLHRIGERWQEGEVQITHEHLASAVVRTFLGNTLEAFQPPTQAPCLIVTTPRGQLHELGALIAAVISAAEGWRTLYLGPNLPAFEIARAALQADARAVALSIVYLPDDLPLAQELTTLRAGLGTQMPLLVGGRATAACRAELDGVEAISIRDMQHLRAELKAYRSREIA